MASPHDMKRYKDFDEKDAIIPTMREVAASIVERLTNYKDAYKVTDTLTERLADSKCACPYCGVVFYEFIVHGVVNGDGNLSYIRTEHHPTETIYSNEQAKQDFLKSRHIIRGSIQYIPMFTKTMVNVDHITPRARGGSDVYHNLIVVCESCNKAKNSLTAEEFGFQEIQKLSQDVPQMPVFTSRGNKKFAVVYLPIEVYEQFHEKYGDVARYVYDKINTGLPEE